jgi:hypothetical protein
MEVEVHMYKEVMTMKEKDWSLNLEDPYYVDNPLAVLKESIEGVRQTREGCYVNLVTPGRCGDPNDSFIKQLEQQLQVEELSVKSIQYIDECGCGGYVTRVYR